MSSETEISQAAGPGRLNHNRKLVSTRTLKKKGLKSEDQLKGSHGSAPCGTESPRWKGFLRPSTSPFHPQFTEEETEVQDSVRPLFFLSSTPPLIDTGSILEGRGRVEVHGCGTWSHLVGLHVGLH